ncbi:ubiquinol oxidase 4, chloroplastic/chromoplastic [Tanacetum coccineum]
MAEIGNNGRSCNFKATTLQEDDEKVVVEETFQPKSFPEEANGGPGEPPNGKPSSSIEKWVIKVEQSINIFLTDTVIKILDVLYHDRDYPRFFVLETIARVPYFYSAYAITECGR